MGEKKQSRTRRANLHFPISRVSRELRGRIGNKRLQKNVDVRVAALGEFLVQRLLVLSADLVTKGNYIDAENVHEAINDEHSELKNVFPKHMTGLY